MYLCTYVFKIHLGGIYIYLKLIKSFPFIISNFILPHISDYKGWTALHHAAFGGYTRTMQIILDTNVKCTDRVDEEGVCFHMALFVSCLLLLLDQT